MTTMNLLPQLEQVCAGLSGVYGSNMTRVRQDCLDLVRECPSLHPHRDSIVHNNGTESTLIVLRGTVPIYYQRNRYNIPVDVWVPALYPQAAPLTYVTPTSTMIVAPNHRHCDREGKVYLPYLHQWNPQHSNLKT